MVRQIVPRDTSPRRRPSHLRPQRQVLEFLRTTFSDNAAALECQFGVGQSLNTCLVANLFGHMHGFMDMNVFYTEDELRKQAGTFTEKVTILGALCLPPLT